MSEPRLTIFRYASDGANPYGLQIILWKEGKPSDSEFKDFPAAQDAFDYCAGWFPGETVAVDIRP